MKSPIYSAKFIHHPAGAACACPTFKKAFSAKGGLKRATLTVSALGVFVAHINGVRVGADFMTPGWTNYKSRLQFFEYDITPWVKAQNELTVGVGGGWYAGFPDFRRYGEYPELIAAITLSYEGAEEVICTDATWLVGSSPVLSSSIYDGECVDARIVPDFAHKAAVSPHPCEILTPEEGVKTREFERLSPTAVIFTPKGEWVLDFGQEITGNIEFTLEDAKSGECVSLECAEILDKDGNFYRENYRSAKARIDYTATAGKQTYKAQYTFFGFRYLRLTGWREEIKPENFTAIVMHSKMRRTGYFKCAHEKLNKLYSNIIWGQRCNFLDLPTDCPQRDEKLGWTGDAQVFARTASINYDTKRFFAKWLEDMKSEQHPDGGIPFVIPDVEGYDRSCSAAWSDAACIVPYEIYRAFGDKKLLRRHFPMMKKWVGYMLSRPGKRYLWQSDEDRQFGDWLGLDAEPGSYTGSTDKNLIASAFFYHSAVLLRRAAEELGYKTERYARLAENIKKAFKKAFIKRGKLVSDTQTAHLLTLHFGLLDDGGELKERISNRLVELIEERGDALSTGFVGTPYLLDTLTEIGRPDKAYKLLLREAFPSWLYSVNMGATTIWEHWDGIDEGGKVWSADMNSFNHYAYGAVAAWLYGTVLGIKPDAPAYKTFTIAPVTSRALGFAKGSISTRHGKIESEWRYENDKIKYTFTVPDGTVCTYALSGGTRGTLYGGKYEFVENAPD